MGKRFHCVRFGTLDLRPPNRQVLLGSSSLGNSDSSKHIWKLLLHLSVTLVCTPAGDCFVVRSLGVGPGASSMRPEKILPFLQCRIWTIILVLPHNGLFGGSNGRQNVCMCVESAIATHLSCTMGQDGARVQETAAGL